MNTLFGNLLDRAERAGAALVICDEHDTIIKANDAHVKIYDCVDYSAMPTFEEFSLRFIEGRKTGNELIYQDPHAWMQAAAQFRRTSDYSQFIARLADGRVMLVCYEKVKDTNNWWYQARIDITGELKARTKQDNLLLGPACWEGTFAPMTRNSVVPIVNVLEAMPAAAGLIMSGGKLLDANQRLRAILADGDGLLQRDDRVVVREPSEHTEFLRRLNRFFRTKGQPVPMAMRVSRQESNRPYFITVSVLSDQAQTTWDNSHIAVLTVASPSKMPSLDPRLLVEFWGITRTEAKIALALAEGHTIVCIAEERGVQVNTVYAQIKSILEKTGYTGQTDIARRIADIARVFGSE